MANTRTYYAVKGFYVKDQRYDNTATLSQAHDAKVSGAVATGDLTISVSGAALTSWPPSGQLRIDSEVVQYSGVDKTGPNHSFLVNTVTGRGFAGSTAATHAELDIIYYEGWEPVRGVQSVDISTTFNLEQIFEFGQSEVYENIEGIPEVEFTVERVLDGTRPLFFMVTQDGASDLIGGVQNYDCNTALNIYDDNQFRASGTARQSVFGSGLVVSNMTYTMPVDGSFTESITLVGSVKTWLNSAGTPDAAFTGVADNATVIGSGVQRREDLDLTLSQFPTDLPAVVTDGIGNGSELVEKLQTITITVDVGREELFKLGQKTAFFRTITFPIDVSCSFEVVTAEGDLIESTDATDNLNNQQITIVTKSGMTFNLGDQNKMLSVEFGGGDTGGGSDTVTYNYQTSNAFTVSHTAFSY
jgi:hypothetical protein